MFSGEKVFPLPWWDSEISIQDWRVGGQRGRETEVNPKRNAVEGPQDVGAEVKRK